MFIRHILNHTQNSSFFLSLRIVPTPTVQWVVKQWNADGGGVIVTSSHNPIEWNGLKFVGPDSLFLRPNVCDEVYALARSPERVIRYAPWTEQGHVTRDAHWGTRHVDAILQLPFVASRLPRLASRAWRVALDTVCGAGGPVMADLLRRLGCQLVVHLHASTSGRFPRPPEPIPEHLHELGEAVRANACDLGLAVDPDVDRCVILDGDGVPVGEEYTLAMAVHYMVVTVGRRGPVVKNLSSSRVTDDICRPYPECPVIATPVGEIHVASEMARINAVIGGEGNGGVLLPELHLGRDAPVAAALVFCFLDLSRSVKEAKATLPQYHIVKLKASVPKNWDRILAHMIDKYRAEGATMSMVDGVRIDTKEGWVHLRKSNTEPVYRVIGEFGSDAATSQQKCQAVIDEVNRLDAQFEAGKGQ